MSSGVLQIPYKLFLGSEKDIEDARFLFKLFEDKLNIGLLKMFLINLKIPLQIRFGQSNIKIS